MIKITKTIVSSILLVVVGFAMAQVINSAHAEGGASNYLSPLGNGGYKIEDANSAEYPDYTVNIIGGFIGNTIDPGYVGATIVGGGALKTQTGEDAANRILGTLGTHLAYSTITGGYDNQMDSAFPSTIGGGAHNRINMATNDSGRITKVPGYIPNIATDHSTIAGGSYNSIYNAHYASINGGSQNSIGNLGATSDNGSINGGTRNELNGINSTISGGSSNRIINSLQSTLAGGLSNTVSGGNSIFLGGGSSNSTNSGFTVLGGGISNSIGLGGSTFGTYSVLGGGHSNSIGAKLSAQFAVLFGGRSNTINGDYSTILGGRDNVASSSFNLVAGRQAKATATGAFVFSDSQAADFIISTPNMFGTRFSGGYAFTGGNVGIGTSTPSEKLTVVGNISAVIGYFKDKVSAAVGIFDSLTIGSATKPTGITIYDSEGGAHCMKVNADNSLFSTTGSCN